MHKACDAHIHLYTPHDARWAQSRAALRDGHLPAYRTLQRRLGCERMVIVQPLLYGTDNSFMLEMLSQVGSAQARGVAIVREDVSDGELDQLKAGGVIGIRFFVGSALRGDDHAETLARMHALDSRVHARGMHFQINTNGAFLARHAALFEGFAAPLVFDHLAHVLPRPDGYMGLAELLRLMRDADVWVKVSGLYLDSADPSGGCDDMLDAVAALADASPDRLVWGTNWPHPTVRVGTAVPDDERLLDQLHRTLPHAVCERMRTTNAAALYQFNDVR